MKKIIIVTLVVLIALHFISRYALGFSVYRIHDALEVASSLGAKLACSSYFVSGFEKAEVVEDLASYSPVTRLLDISYDDQKKQVTSDLFGLSQHQATYREGLGCSLDIGDTAGLNELSVPEIAPDSGAWPQGNDVSSHVDTMQSIVDSIMVRDNQQGKQTRALLVVQGDEIVAEAYGPGIDAETQLLGWSMAKSLTAIMLGRLQKLEDIDLEQSTGFIEWQQDERRQITLKQLMQMSSGLAFDETYAPGSDSTRMLFTEHSASDVALTAEYSKLPGTHFSYSSGTTNLLMRWMRNHLGSNQALIDFFYHEIASPMGLTATTFEVAPDGLFVGSSYLFATGRDWARMGFLMLNNGMINGESVLSEDWVREAFTPNQSDNNGKYGYQFWLNSDGKQRRWPKLPEDAYMMMGNRKQIVMIVPSQNLVIVRLGWTSGRYPTEANFAEIVTAAKNTKQANSVQAAYFGD